MTLLCMLAGRLSAPPLSAAWAAEGTLLALLLFGAWLTWLALLLLLLFGAWLTWLASMLPGAAAAAPPVGADVPLEVSR
jgi:hypothetical protein